MQVITTIAGDSVRAYNGDGIPGTAAELNQPYFIALDGSGNVYFLEDGIFNVKVRSVSDQQIIVRVPSPGGRKEKEFITKTDEDEEVNLEALPGCYFIIAASAAGRSCQQIIIQQRL